MNTVVRQTATVTPLRAPSPDENLSVQVSYGPNTEEFQVPSGGTVGTVLDNRYIAEIIGFQGSPGESVTVNGEPAARDRVLAPGDRVEVIKAAGEKA